MAASDSPGAIILFIILTTLIVLSTLVVCVLLVMRRKIYPLNGRDISLIIPIQILILFNVCATAVRALSPPPCAFAMIPGIFVPAITIVCAIFRLLRLVFLYKFAQEKLELHKASRDEIGSSKALSITMPEAKPEDLALVETIRELRSMEAIKFDKKRIDTLVESIREEDFGRHEKLLLKHGAVLSMLREPSKWFANHRYMIDSAWMWKVIFPLSFAFIFLGSLVYGVSVDLPNGDREDGPCPRYERTLTVQAILFVSLFVILCYTIWLVRNVRDGYYIKREFKYFGLSFVVLMIFNILRSQKVDVVSSFPVIEFFVLIGYTITLSTSGLYPLYLSYSEEFITPLFSSLTSSSEEVDDAKGVPIFVFLTDDRYAMERHDFERMLIKEFSVENLLFFHAVRRFEQLKVDKKIEEDPDATCELLKSGSLPASTAGTIDACDQPSVSPSKKSSAKDTGGDPEPEIKEEDAKVSVVVDKKDQEESVAEPGAPKSEESKERASTDASGDPEKSLSKKQTTGADDTPISVIVDKETEEESATEPKTPESKEPATASTDVSDGPEKSLSKKQATEFEAGADDAATSASVDKDTQGAADAESKLPETEASEGPTVTATDAKEKPEVSLSKKEPKADNESSTAELCVQVPITTDACDKPEVSFCEKECVAVDDAPVSVLEFGLKAMEIYQRFVWRGAPYQVNLSDQVSKPIEREVLAYFGEPFVKAYCEADGETLSTIKLEKTEPIRKDIFGKAQKRILKLMATDTYLRWKINRSRERSKSIAAERSRKASVTAHFDDAANAEVSV